MPSDTSGMVVVDMLSNLSYVGVFFAVMTAGYIIPIPEEIFLLSVGYLGAIGVINPFVGLMVSIAALLVGDSIVFALARHGFPYAARMYTRLLKTHLGRKFKMRSEDHLSQSVFMLRFIPGLRFLSPLMAAMHKVSFVRFFFIDLLAITAYSAIYILVGYHLSDSFLRIMVRVEEMRHVIFSGILFIVAIIIISWAYKVAMHLEEEAS
jgi:membrane protein DedA with SNARE-associated domain